MQKKQIELLVSTAFYVFLRFDLIESEQAFSLISDSYLDRRMSSCWAVAPTGPYSDSQTLLPEKIRC